LPSIRAGPSLRPARAPGRRRPTRRTCQDQPDARVFHGTNRPSWASSARRSGVSRVAACRCSRARAMPSSVIGGKPCSASRVRVCSRSMRSRSASVTYALALGSTGDHGGGRRIRTHKDDVALLVVEDLVDTLQLGGRSGRSGFGCQCPGHPSLVPPLLPAPLGPGSAVR
jgi:hypothetical protein